MKERRMPKCTENCSCNKSKGGSFAPFLKFMQKRSLYLNPGTRVRYEDAVTDFNDEYDVQIDCRVKVGEFSATRPAQGQCTCGRECDTK